MLFPSRSKYHRTWEHQESWVSVLLSEAQRIMSKVPLVRFGGSPTVKEKRACKGNEEK